MECETGPEFDITKRFFPGTINRPVTIVVLADPGVGKTTLATDLVMSLKDTLFLDMATVITKDEDPSYFANIIDEDMIHRGVQPASVAAGLLECQRRTQKSTPEGVPRFAAVFDDVFHAAADWKGMNPYVLNARNRNILTILTAVDPASIPSILRQRCDYVFIARSMSFSQRKKAWSHFGDMFEKFEEFNDNLTSLGTREFLVLHKTSRLRDLGEIVSRYTPTVYLAEPITCAAANAFGKWHLLDGRFDEGRARETIDTFRREEVEGTDPDDVSVKPHTVFRITHDGMRSAFLDTLREA